MATAVHAPSSLNRPLAGVWLAAARGVWLLLAGLAAALLLVSVTNTYTGYSHMCTASVDAPRCANLRGLGFGPAAQGGLALYLVSAVSLMVASWTLMGWLVFLRSPASAASLVMSLGLVTGWATDLTGLHLGFASFVAVTGRPAVLAAWYLVMVVSQVAVVAMMLLLPDGRFRPRWAAVLVAVWGLHVPFNTLYHHPFSWWPGSLFAEVLDETFVLAVPLLIIAAVWSKYRAATHTARAQLRTLLPSARAFSLAYALFSVWNLFTWPVAVPDQNLLQFGSQLAQIGVQSALGAWFGLAVGTAVLRYNLLRTDLFVSRALVYGSLSGVLLLLYLGLVFGVGGLAGLSRTPWFPLVATALVLVLFEPLRARLTRRVERALYGVREPPYRAFAGVSRQLQTLVPDDYFPDLVETVGRWFRLPFVRLSARAGAFRTEACVGTLHGEAVPFPIVSRGEILGVLEVAVRPGEVLTAEERGVLATIAGQLGVSLRSLATAAELQAVRERLVNAREAERRRLQRDLHDGLGPALAAQALVAGSARALLVTDPARADGLLGQLEHDLHGTLEEVRRLVHSLSPSDLEQLGLCGALRLRTAALAGDRLRLELTLPAAPPPLSAAAESAAYYLVTEAVTNVVRHSSATTCRVELGTHLSAAAGRLELSVTDDGLGLGTSLNANRRGVGLLSMKERAEELGGRFAVTACVPGTRVWASLPLSSPSSLLSSPPLSGPAETPP